MRVAVGLPSLPSDAPNRIATEAVFSGLVEQGLDLEGFGEDDRLASDVGFPVFHYLRMPERHESRPFDRAVYPLGRDAGDYRSILNAMSVLPGMVWVVDPVLHHLVAGGLALRDRWREYYEKMESAYPTQGAGLTNLLASSWGTSWFHSHYDPTTQMLRDQPALATTSRGLQVGLECRQKRPVAIVPLAIPHSPQVKHTASGESLRVSILSPNLTWADPTLDALEMLLKVDRIKITVCLPEPTYQVAWAPAVTRRGLSDRVRWLRSPSWGDLADEARRCDLPVFLRQDMVSAERAILLEAMGAGKTVLVPHGALYVDLPTGAVARIEGGRIMGLSLATMVTELAGDDDLRRAIGKAGQAYVMATSSPMIAVDKMIAALDDAGQEKLRPRSASSSTWLEISRDFETDCTPGGAGPRTRAEVRRVWERLQIPGLEPGSRVRWSTDSQTEGISADETAAARDPA